MINKNRPTGKINYEKLYGAAVCKMTLITELLRLCQTHYGEETTNRVMRKAIAALDDREDKWWERMADIKPLGEALDELDPEGKRERDVVRLSRTPELWYRKRKGGLARLRGR